MIILICSWILLEKILLSIYPSKFIRDIGQKFSFFVLSVDYVDGFPYIESSLHPWDEAYLIVVNDHFDVFLD